MDKHDEKDEKDRKPKWLSLRKAVAVVVGGAAVGVGVVVLRRHMAPSELVAAINPRAIDSPASNGIGNAIKSWPVKEHVRHQPYGPRSNPSYRDVTIASQTRSRH